jgi:ubiquinone/menaquinone biosynthesis C-methylase UbiE
VGSFDAHNAYEDYEQLFMNLNLIDKIMLDFGCGPGRNIVKYWNRLARIDGADISHINLQKANEWIRYNGFPENYSKLYHVDGISLDTVPSNTYDIVMSVITMQHICVYDIRMAILTDMYRVLKNNGWITLQMGYGPDRVGAVDYYANDYTKDNTNGACDVLVTNEKQLSTDLEKIGFRNFSCSIHPCGPGDLHNNWIFFRSQK